MIELTGLGGSTFLLNSSLIETIESIPETKITLTNGKYYLVAEEKEEIVQKIIAYNRQIFCRMTELMD
jgi:flagellar protein FlbD